MDGGNAADELAKELESKVAITNDAGEQNQNGSLSFSLQQTCDVIETWFAIRDGLVGVDLTKKGCPGSYGVSRQAIGSSGATGYGMTGANMTNERAARVQTKADLTGGRVVSSTNVTDSIQAEGDNGLKLANGGQGVWYLVREHWEER